ncbi:MAG: DNA polymerase III subunit beta [Candidatus Omnitrophica bacterium]|nr:DNA polymerase III subunit beta [Candidatus Omnitrophota bacterium]
MRIKVEKEILLERIQAIAGVVNSKNTLPILSNILIEAGKDGLKCTTTNLDIGMTTTIPADVLEEGAITTPAKRLTDIIRELPDATIEISAKKNNMVVVESGGIVFKVLGVPKEEFPKLPQFTDKEEMVLEQSMFRKMLGMSSFAMSNDETRYVLNGICLIITKDKIRMVATDGRRLAIVNQKNDTKLKTEKKVIIPTKTVQELARSLQEEGEVSIVFSKNQIMFRANGLVVVSRLIEGEFPNYEQAIPKEIKTKLKIDAQKLCSAIKRANLLTTVESQAIKLQLSKNSLVVSKSTPEVGEVKEDIEAEYSGEEFVIGFNPTYLLDVLKNIDQQSLEIELTGPDKPGVIRGEEGYIYIVLPMQVT